ncbi:MULTISPECIES: Crp/Fnr family transcriptional regulator [Neobacillus]|uniref:Crp/Fnr family transcriptional regulator n=1 Tax=Neobacillus rhizophilus TaxID=2833579 RepID=A0A942U3M1_9BACI|nr:MULTISPECIES: Crp/Fnr family transcriptional regulator [Neobacillus]MBS4212168.1 Crp/Fnr family transcriptional regulator [Neobacillus rhizophilus]MBU8915598.1 Crp/Fnr family transcriptional regulator [Bacillus sp. FJAT-29953]
MVTTMKPTHSIEIKELLNFADRKFKSERGRFLFQEGMLADDLYVIISGKIQISKITADGRELSLRICGENDICGELTLFTDSPKYLLSAKVLEEGEIAAIKKEVLESEIFQNSKLAFEFMKWMSDHFRKTQTKFRDLVLNGKRGALFSTLIRMTNSYGVPKSDGILIDLPLTNQELANFCGTSRESTNRILSELKRDNIISIKRGKITVLDLQYLKDEIGCENCSTVYCSIE